MRRNTPSLEFLVYNVREVEMLGVKQTWCETYPGQSTIIFDPELYEETHMVLHGKTMYRLKRTEEEGVVDDALACKMRSLQGEHS